MYIIVSNVFFLRESQIEHELARDMCIFMTTSLLKSELLDYLIKIIKLLPCSFTQIKDSITNTNRVHKRKTNYTKRKDLAHSINTDSQRLS